MPRASIGDIEIDYRVIGAGPPLVLLHGLACGQRMWIRQLRRLGARHRLVLYDQRGHGRTSAPDDPARYSPGHLARDLAGLLDHLGLERVHLLGFSMGGGPALALAARSPERVASLILADVGSGAEDGWKIQWLAQRWAGFARAGGMDAMADDMLRSEFFKTYANRSARARRHMRALIASNPLDGLRHTLTEVLGKRRSLFRMTGTLAALRPPTLVLTGQHDYVCLRAAKLLKGAIPGAAEARIPGAGHMSPLEAPDAFNAAVETFLAAHR